MMKIIRFNNFDKITNTFVVRNIMDVESLFFVKANDQIKDFPYHDKHRGKKFWESEFWVCFVRNSDEKIIGYYSKSILDNENIELLMNDDEDEFIDKWGKIARNIPSDKFVTADTPIVDAISLFYNENDYFIVIDRNEIVGLLSFFDLDCNEMKISMFSLILELDSILDKLIVKANIDINEKIGMEKLDELKAKLNESEKKRSILHYLNILKKLRLVEDELIKQSIFENRKAIDDFGGKVLNVRNKVAHGDTLIGDETEEIIEIRDKEVKGETYSFMPVKINIHKYEVLSTPESMKKFIFDMKNVIDKLNYIMA